MASCSNENDDITDGGEKETDVAYMSVSVAVPQEREHAAGSSGETDALDSELRSRSFIWFCLMTKKVVKADGATACYTILGECSFHKLIMLLLVL